MSPRLERVRSAQDKVGLEIIDLRVAYGGNVAVRGVTLSAPLGSITGLIGPNGAGKTTTFDACSGLVRPRAGSVRLFREDITDVGAAARARMGLGRTFQRVEMCHTMSVRENVALGREARDAGSHPVRHLFEGRSARRSVAESTDYALSSCGIANLAEQRAGATSIGQRRMLEMARALAGGARLLLLDEPASGLDDLETGRFTEILRRLVEVNGLGVLLIEHDIALVMSCCDWIYVLDYGECIFDGTPAEVRSSDVVRAAYLGRDAPLRPADQ